MDMLSDSITTLLCMMETPSHPFHKLIPKNKNDSFYMDSVSYPYIIRTLFYCNSTENQNISHHELLTIYLNLLIKARFNYSGSEHQESIDVNQCQYKIKILCIQ